MKYSPQRLARVVRSPAELSARLRHVLRTYGERLALRRLRSWDESSWADVLQVNSSEVNDDSLLADFRERTYPRFFPGVDQDPVIAQRFVEWFPDAVAANHHRANDVLHGKFDLLGLRHCDFGMPIKWDYEPIRERQAPRVHWSRVPYLDASVVGDHKVIWELNRHQFLLRLGQEYWFTGDERYAAHALRLMTDWMIANPRSVGINWASSLEVALRCVAWIWTLYYVRRSSSLSASTFRRIVIALHAQGAHIEKYLSTYFSPNTHLTGEAVALVYLGTMFPLLRFSDRWRRLGWHILEEHIPQQILRDGVYFEQSTHYSRYTADFLLHVIVLGEQNGQKTSSRLYTALLRLLDYLYYMQRPDGSLVPIGDEDGGELAPLDNISIGSAAALFSTSAILFNNPHHAYAAQQCVPRTMWLLGHSAYARFNTITQKPPEQVARVFEVGGYCSVRSDWSDDADHLVMDCGPFGAMAYGHSHADALAICVTWRGKPIISDGGTFSYSDQDARSYFRSPAAHSGVSIDGETGSEPLTAFSWRRVTHAQPVLAELKICDMCCHGTMAWRLDSGDDVRVTRSAYLSPRRFIALRDRLLARGYHRMTTHFHLERGLTATALADRSVIRSSAGDVTLTIVFCGEAKSSMRIGAHDGWQSRIYGEREKCVHLTAEHCGDGDQEVISFLLSGEASVLELKSHDGCRRFAVSSADFRGIVCFDQESITQIAENVALMD